MLISLYILFENYYIQISITSWQLSKKFLPVKGLKLLFKWKKWVNSSLGLNNLLNLRKLWAKLRKYLMTSTSSIKVESESSYKRSEKCLNNTMPSHGLINKNSCILSLHLFIKCLELFISQCSLSMLIWWVLMVNVKNISKSVSIGILLVVMHKLSLGMDLMCKICKQQRLLIKRTKLLF